MVKSVLDAIKQGIWDYEPQKVGEKQFSATKAMPGTDAKLEVLAKRIESGLPLWHGEDRMYYDEDA